MIVALYCVAAAMIVGGVWSAFAGWEYVIIERGWTQVLVGAMAATGGVVLAGLATVAAAVKSLERRVAANQPAQRLSPAAVPPATMPPAAPDRAPRAAEIAGAAGLAAGLAAAGFASTRPEAAKAGPIEPRLDAVEPRPAPRALADGLTTAAVMGAGLAASRGEALANEDRSGDVRPDEDKAEASLSDQSAPGEEKRAESAADAVAPEPSRDEPSALDETTPDEARAASLDERGTDERPSADEPTSLVAARETVGGDSGRRDDEDEPAPAETGVAEPVDLQPEEVQGDEIQADEIQTDDSRPGEEADSTSSPAREAFGDHDERRADDLVGDFAEDLPEDLSDATDRDAAPSWAPVERDGEADRGSSEMGPVEADEASAEAVAARPPEASVSEAAPAVPFAEEDAFGEDVAEAEAPVAGPAVIGTYESGGNLYTMYADGSIHALTPDGEYRFASLDELKTFIAEGGEDRRD